MNLYLFFILVFSQNTDSTIQPPDNFQLFTFNTYEECVEVRNKVIFEYSTNRLPYETEFTLCQKVDREASII